MDATLESLNSLSVHDKRSGYAYSVKTQEDLDYSFALQKQLKKLKDIEVRVESPWITIYTNNKIDVDTLVKLDHTKVKYVSAPDTILEKDTIVMPKMDYEFRITLGKTIREHSAFVGWAASNSKVKLTKSCIKDLNKDRSWGGTYFYITGEKNLLVARMHLGGSINKIERIIK